MRKLRILVSLLLLYFLTACTAQISGSSGNGAEVTVYKITICSESGSQMSYYICQISGRETSDAALYLDMDAISAVFDASAISKQEELEVYGHPAAFFVGEDRTYLCCTTSPGYTVILEYDPEELATEDALHIIRSVFTPE